VVYLAVFANAKPGIWDFNSGDGVSGGDGFRERERRFCEGVERMVGEERK